MNSQLFFFRGVAIVAICITLSVFAGIGFTRALGLNSVLLDIFCADVALVTLIYLAYHFYHKGLKAGSEIGRQKKSSR